MKMRDTGKAKGKENGDRPPTAASWVEKSRRGRKEKFSNRHCKFL